MTAAALTPGQTFLRAIVEAPSDDTPRLVYADWLDEHGQAARAEFIRVQCELAGLDDGTGGPPVQPNNAGVSLERWHALRRRERELLPADGFPPVLPFRHVVHSWADMGLVPAVAGDAYAVWRRGFVASVTCHTADFLRPGLAAALFACQPVCSVTLSDKRPEPSGERYYWYRWARDEPRPLAIEHAHHLPYELFGRLEAGADYCSVWQAYRSGAEAQAALSAAAVALGSAAAGLPPLP
jgi:uncharacterized protein (TIGR02996 family)